MFVHFCSVLIDGVFLSLWGAVNVGVSVLFSHYHLEGLDAIIPTVFRALFGLATLIPNSIFIYRDIRVMWIKASIAITKAEE